MITRKFQHKDYSFYLLYSRLSDGSYIYSCANILKFMEDYEKRWGKKNPYTDNFIRAYKWLQKNKKNKWNCYNSRTFFIDGIYDIILDIAAIGDAVAYEDIEKWYNPDTCGTISYEIDKSICENYNLFIKIYKEIRK